MGFISRLPLRFYIRKLPYKNALKVTTRNVRVRVPGGLSLPRATLLKVAFHPIGV